MEEDRRKLYDVVALTAMDWVYSDFESPSQPWVFGGNKVPPPWTDNVKVGRREYRISYATRCCIPVGDDSNLLAQKGTLVVIVESLPAGGERERWLVLAFRGAARTQDWVANVGGVLPNGEPFRNLGLEVQGGWYNMVVENIPGASPGDHGKFAQEAMLEAATEEADKGATSLLVVGHSLGGALAQIAALLIWQRAANDSDESLRLRLMMNTWCITAASPMPFMPARVEVGGLSDEKQRAARAWMQERFHNYVNNNDPVPRLPGQLDFMEKLLRGCGPILVGPGVNGAMARINPLRAFVKARRELPALEGYSAMGRLSFVGHDAQAPCFDLAPDSPEALGYLRALREPDPSNPGGLANWYSGGVSDAVQEHLLPAYRARMESAWRQNWGLAVQSGRAWAQELAERPDGAPLRTLSGHGGLVGALCMAGPDLLASGSADSTVRLW